jgi:recombination DNA repair RAD52 pathway protein
MALKTQSEIEAALATPYDGPIFEKNGFSYIPAREAIKTMNDIFGPLGWSDEITGIEAHPEQGIYVAAIRLTVNFLDENGIERVVTRGDVGRSTADASGRERNEGNAGIASNQLIVHDRAAAAAATDAFSRATKKFGPALGSALYDKENQRSNGGAATRPMANAAPANASGDLGRRPSEKQAAILEKNGIAYEGVPYEVWHSALDAHFEKMKARTASAASW